MGVDELVGVVQALAPDARRALLYLAHRLAEGQRRYGRLELATDARDFELERAEEVADLLAYTAFLELRRVAPALLARRPRRRSG